MGKKRILERKLNELLQMFPVVAVLGPRQCGKSTLVKQARPDWKYYDLESPSDYQLISSDPLSFFKLNSRHILIDEAQQYPDLFKTIRGVVDANRNQNGRFILTGSSSPDIVKGLTESLAGRIATIEMWPFKATEYYEREPSQFYSLINSSNCDLENFEKLTPSLDLEQALVLWHKGGFPEPLIKGQNNNDFYNQWMENFISNYVSRDIRGLFPKLNIHYFKRFLNLLAQFSGHPLNMSDMARSLEITSSTVKDYLDIIHKTFIWRNLDAFEKNVLKKVQKSKKGFFRDPGLLHYFLKIRSLDDLLIHPIAGFSFESFVTEEIIRGFQGTMATQIDFSYYRTIDKSEIDLIIDGPFGVLPVEIKLSSSVKIKSLTSLERILTDMKLKMGILVNRGNRVERLTEKIIQVPVHYL